MKIIFCRSQPVTLKNYSKNYEFICSIKVTQEKYSNKVRYIE